MAKSNRPAADIENTVEESCGNVFADLGLPDAEELLAKSQLAVLIVRSIRARRLTQAQAAAHMGTQQPKVSAIMRGRLDEFSIERLMQFLVKLGQDVVITVQPPKRRKPAAMKVRSVAA